MNSTAFADRPTVRRAVHNLGPDTQPQPRPAHSAVVDHDLTFIAREVAGDHGIKVLLGAEGGGSCASIEERWLVLDPEHISDPDRRVFVAAHEGMHFADTPSYGQLGITSEGLKELVRKLGFLALSNVIEDCAGNDRMARDLKRLRDPVLKSYPRAGTELGCINHPEVQKAILLLGSVPRYGRALAALLADWSELRHRHGFGQIPADYLSEPYSGPPPNDRDIEQFLTEVLPEARRATSMIYGPKATAEERLLAGQKRHIWCREVLYPALARLVELDKKDLMAQLKERAANIPGDSNGEGADSDGTSGAAAKRSGRNVDQKECARQAEEALAAFDDALRETLKSMFDRDCAPTAADSIKELNAQARNAERGAATAREFSEGCRGLKDSLMRSLSPYQRYFASVSGAIDEAYGRLLGCFFPEREFRWQPKQPSGKKIDILEAMRFTATGEGANTLFMRRIEPIRPDIGIVVLIDRSGSMGAGSPDLDERAPATKIELAISGGILVRELFQRLGVRTACIGFADEQEVLINFDEDCREPEVQDRMMKGLSTGGGTQDASALEFSANLLRGENRRRSVILVISDAGTGEGGRLGQVVRELEAQGLIVIHFGLGTGTADTQGNYTRSFGDLELSAFTDVFCAQMEVLARELLLGGGNERIS